MLDWCLHPPSVCPCFCLSSHQWCWFSLPEALWPARSLFSFDFGEKQNCLLPHTVSFLSRCSSSLPHFLSFSITFNNSLSVQCCLILSCLLIGKRVQFIAVCCNVSMHACVLMYVCVLRGNAESRHSFVPSQCVTHHDWGLSFMEIHRSFILIVHLSSLT